MNINNFKYNPSYSSAIPSLFANIAGSTTVTDVAHVLKVTRMTFELNKCLLNADNECRIIELDWTKEIKYFDRYYDIIIAAECAYSRDTCTNLFRLINFMITEEKPRQLLFAIEERPNFMMDTMSVRCHERDRFIRQLNILQLKHPMMATELQTCNLIR